MHACHNCESPVHPSWDFCPRCHADLAATGTVDVITRDVDDVDGTEREPDTPEPAEDIPPRLTPRLSPAVHAGAWTPSLAARARSRLRAMRSFVREDGRIERLREARIPAWSLVVAFGGFLLALTLVAGDPGDGDALASARQAQQDAAAQAAQLSTALATAEAAEAGLRDQVQAAQEELASLQGDAAGSETQIGTLQTEAATLRAQVDQARQDLEARDTTIEDQEASIAALTECLGGISVALQFGRQGLWDPADRALQSVAGACADSGIVI